jgi:cyclic dehypoxanthinyl futalosine synthase
VGYLNARPLCEGLDREPAASRVRFDCATPAEVARRVAEDDADIGLMPVAAAASIGGLRMIPGAVIGARGPVRSVVVVAEQPVETIDELAVDLSSRTSVVLTRLILRRRRPGGTEPRLLGALPREALAQVGGARGALIIGDPALEVEGRFPFVLDLGQAWHEETGLPFVFAAWFGRAGALGAGDQELFESAKRAGLVRRDAIADEYAARTGLPPASIRAYLREAVRFDFDDDDRRGLELFFDEAARAGLLPRAQVQFFEAARAPRGPGGALPRADALLPPLAARGDAPQPSLDGLLARAADGERLSAAEGERLAEEASLFDLGVAADAVRRRKHPHGVVTYIVDRNVNYTNVCTTSCRFCAFYRPPGHAEGYVLSREELGRKLKEVVDAGGVQILLQGGLHPELRIEWYEDLFRWIKREFRLGLHALSPEEILHIGRLEDLTVRAVLERLHAAGLDSVPGGGAEILVDRVRRTIAKAKCRSDEWLGVMRVAHQMGLRSSATMMYGTVDTMRDRVLHLLKIRDLQDETGGFTAFFCWDFQHEKGTQIEPGDHGTLLYLRQQAVARLLLDNVDHVGASWVTQGPEIGQVALRFGADDFGSVMFEENVVSSAGTTFCMNADTIEQRIRAAGFRAARRNVHYQWLTAPA